MRATVELVGAGELDGPAGELLAMTRELEAIRIYLNPRDQAGGTIAVLIVRRAGTLEHELRVVIGAVPVVVLPLPLERPAGWETKR